MAANQPLVSVCIPAYNCEKYIEDTLNCLCAQNYPNIELIMINDGSTDHTLTLAKNVVDSRLRLVNVPNGGAARARNLAYQYAKGEYIIFFDADDYIQPDFISRQIDRSNNRTDIIVLSGWGRFYNDDLNTFKADDTPDGEITFKEWITLYWYHCNPMTNPGRALIPAAVIKKAGLWNEELSLNDDLEFFTRIFLNSSVIVFNKDAVFYYRSGINGLSGKTGNEANESLYQSIQLSVDKVVSKYGQDTSILKSCANIWQSYIYITYPFYQKHLQLAYAEIKKLVKPDFRFRSSGYTRLISTILGWKLTKRIKLAINKQSNGGSL